MSTILVICGWILWCIVALISLCFIVHYDKDNCVRYMMRMNGVALAIGLVMTALLPISKFHLLWVVPLSPVLTMLAMQHRINRARSRALTRNATSAQLNDLREFLPERVSSELETALTSGDQDRVLEVIASAKKEAQSELKSHGIDADSFVPEVGRDFKWSEVVRQVFRVLEFDRGLTKIGPDGRPKPPSSFSPYGYLLVESPILHQAVRLPIVHRDDFVLATIVFDSPHCDEILEEAELLVTYAPKRTLPGGKTWGISHVLHYALCPLGTLEKYYDFDNDIHMRTPAPEKLFGKFVYEGEAKVQINRDPEIDTNCYSAVTTS